MAFNSDQGGHFFFTENDNGTVKLTFDLTDIKCIFTLTDICTKYFIYLMNSSSRAKIGTLRVHRVKLTLTIKFISAFLITSECLCKL